MPGHPLTINVHVEIYVVFKMLPWARLPRAEW